MTAFPTNVLCNYFVKIDFHGFFEKSLAFRKKVCYNEKSPGGNKYIITAQCRG